MKNKNFKNIKKTEKVVFYLLFLQEIFSFINKKYKTKTINLGIFTCLHVYIYKKNALVT